MCVALVFPSCRVRLSACHWYGDLVSSIQGAEGCSWIGLKEFTRLYLQYVWRKVIYDSAFAHEHDGSRHVQFYHLLSTSSSVNDDTLINAKRRCHNTVAYFGRYNKVKAGTTSTTFKDQPSILLVNFLPLGDSQDKKLLIQRHPGRREVLTRICIVLALGT